MFNCFTVLGGSGLIYASKHFGNEQGRIRPTEKFEPIHKAAENQDEVKSNAAPNSKKA